MYTWCICFFFQAEDGIRDLVRSRGLGDVYKRQQRAFSTDIFCSGKFKINLFSSFSNFFSIKSAHSACLLYTSDAADERSSVDLGGRRIIKKKKYTIYGCRRLNRKKTKTH